MTRNCVLKIGRRYLTILTPAILLILGILTYPVDIKQQIPTGEKSWERNLVRQILVKKHCNEKSMSSRNKVYVIDPYTISHLHYDRERQFLYCFVPKVACTSWKRIWMKLTHLIDEDDDIAKLKRIDVHSKIPKLHSLRPSEQMQMLSTYRKFLFVRNPFSRILSAYKDKIERRDYESSVHFQEIVNQEINYMYRKNATQTSFTDFIQYITDDKPVTEMQKNEHWRSISKLCDPCAIQYDYIGAFENLKEDSEFVLRWMGSNEDDASHFPRSDRPTNSEGNLNIYYSLLNETLRQAFVETFYEDFNSFGYSMQGP